MRPFPRLRGPRFLHRRAHRAASALFGWLVTSHARPALAQHDHSHGPSLAADPLTTAQALVLGVAAIVVLRTLRDILRARPAADGVVVEYRRVRRVRARRQAIGLAVGLVLGLAAYAGFDARFHTGRVIEDPRLAAARARVEGPVLDDDALFLLEAALTFMSPPAADPDADADADADAEEHAGHDHDAEPHDAEPHDAEPPADVPDAPPDWFHRIMFATTGSAVVALVALLIPVPPAVAAAEPPAPAESSAEPPDPSTEPPDPAA